MENINYCTPLFDDNGDGKSDDNDGTLASKFYLPTIQIWGLPPYIDNITLDHVITNTNTTPIFVKVIQGDRPIQNVRTQIIHPKMELTGIEAIINPKTIELAYNAGQNLYVGNLDELYLNGVYTLSTYAMDLVQGDTGG